MPDTKFRLLISDIDGTLVTNDKVLTETAIAATHDLHEAGVAFAIATARPPRGAAMLIAPLSLTMPIAGFNGGLIVELDMTVIEAWPIDPQAARQIVDFLLIHDFDVWIYDEADWYLRDPRAPHVEREAWMIRFAPTVVTNFTDVLLQRAFKIVGVSDDLEKVASGEQMARTSLGHFTSAARSTPYFLDFTHVRANKGEVVETLARRLGTSIDHVATIGDMVNDVAMFRHSGFSVAMGNASDTVKAEASAVTASNEDEGFAKAVRDFILPGAKNAF